MNWTRGKIEERYSLDDLVDLYLNKKGYEDQSEYDNKWVEQEAKYYFHCYDCLSRAFEIDLDKSFKNLDKSSQRLINDIISKALHVRTPTSGYQQASIFYRYHGENLRDISNNVKALLQLYRQFIISIICQHSDLENEKMVSKEQFLNAGYDKGLIPNYDGYDDIF